MIYKIKPVFKDYLWGGTRLKEEFHKESELEIIAESWELSAHRDGCCKVDDVLFTEYLEKATEKQLGKQYDFSTSFPFLIKYIDAKQMLSIQVHPSDAYAHVHDNDNGKTEVWYVMDAQEGSFLYLGFNQALTKEEARVAIDEDTILDKLNKVYVKKGDVVFIEPGTVHAIGAGILLCEVQQNSNSTYRVYDFKRTDKDGKYRELHVEKALDVSTLDTLEVNLEREETIITGGSFKEVATCSYFTSHAYKVTSEIQFSTDERSFCCINILEGTLLVSSDDQTITCLPGDSLFIEANTENIKINGTGEFLVSQL